MRHQADAWILCGQLLPTAVESGISRNVAADGCGISHFKLDRIERGVDVGEDVRKAYDARLPEADRRREEDADDGTKSTAKKTTVRTRGAEASA
jgi:hypothetical protein